MEIALWKQRLPAVFDRLCREVRVNDAAIDWIDVAFEHVGNATYCPPHSHTWFEFNYILTGTVVTLFEEQPHTVRAGECFLIPPGLTHSHIYTKGNPHEGFNFRFRLKPAPWNTDSPPAAGVSLHALLSGLTEWPPGAFADDFGLGEKLLELFAAGMNGESPLSLQLRLVQAIESLGHKRRAQAAREREPGKPGIDKLVKQVEIYLEDFYGEQVNAAALAASLHMSYGHLARLYKKKTGRTIIGRMNELRLEKARRLLEDPSLLVKEAALRAGFPDLYYFSRTFKRKYGVSPRDYRKSRGV